MPLRFLAVCCLLGSVSATAQVDVPGRSPAVPAAPIKLDAPAIPSSMVGELDLTKYQSEALSALALQTSKQGAHDRSIQLQHWSIANGDGNSGLYNLACFYSLAGDVDACIYWLQRAAVKEGVDLSWVRRDSDLKKLRDDARWEQIEAFLRKCETYWQGADVFETSLILPEDYDGETKLPLLIGLHGMGSRAKDYVDDDLQEFADDLQVAFLGVSGSEPKGPTSFHWAEDPQRDLQQIDRGLKQVAGKLSYDPKQVGLFGFSQGGMMAIEIAARHPKRFAGAMAISPGGRTNANLAPVKPSDDHQLQTYVVIYGAKEAIGNVLMAKQYVKQIDRLGARVIDRPTADQTAHSYPLDFYARLPSWIEHLLGG